MHVDHITGAGRLRESFDTQVAVGSATGVKNADRLMRDGDRITFGSYSLEARSTPGHTSGCMTYVVMAGKKTMIAFTGDTLLIRGCGRTDFQEGDPRTLYRSVHKRIFLFAL